MDNLSNGDDFRQFTGFARIDGAVMGIMWIVSFFCFVGEFEYPLLAILALCLGLGSVIVGIVRLCKFRDSVLGGYISFGKAMLYSIMIYFYAALLLAVAQYVYFQFVDKGYLINQYITQLSVPDNAKMVKEVYGMEAKQLIAILQSTMAALRPIEIAFQFLTLNVILAIILSVPAGALTRRKRV